MQELNASEIEKINGGLVPLLLVLGFVWSNADRLREFCDGIGDGIIKHQ